jgi:hypothetical protein
MALAKYAHTRLADIGYRVLSLQGEDMAATKTARAPKSEPITTLADIDEALLHTSLAVERDEHWHRWADGLLDERNRIARSGPRREMRVMYPAEYRDA